MEQTEHRIIAQPLAYLGRRSPRAYPAGRVCAEVACRTLLSVYNPGVRCSVHAPPARLSGGPGVGRKKKAMVA